MGTTTKDAKLAIVTEPPSFIQPLNDVTTQLGSTETFECIVAGTPRPEVVWLRDGNEIKKGKRVLFEEEPALDVGGYKYKVSFANIVMKDFGKVCSHFRYTWSNKSFAGSLYI